MKPASPSRCAVRQAVFSHIAGADMRMSGTKWPGYALWKITDGRGHHHDVAAALERFRYPLLCHGALHFGLSREHHGPLILLSPQVAKFCQEILNYPRAVQIVWVLSLLMYVPVELQKPTLKNSISSSAGQL